MKRNYRLVAGVVAGMIGAAALQMISGARAVQNEIIPPTSGIYTGVQYSQLIGDALRSVVSGNKGPSAPANVAGGAVDGLPWIDDTTSIWLKKRYINGGWATEGGYDSVSNSWVGIIGGGAPVSIASASTVDLGSVPQANVGITGTTSVTAFGASAAAGVVKIIRFDNALTLVHSASLKIPGGFPLLTAADDRAIVTHLGSGTWEVTQYTRASGVAFDAAAVGKIQYGIFEQVPAQHVAGYGQALSRSSYPAYLAKVTRAQNGTRTSGNATISTVANTAGLGAGMPVEGAGINAGCTIASVTSSTIVLNSSACVTSSGASTVTAFLTGYGAGGSASTVGVPDCRNRMLAGRDRNDPGSFASRLTSTYFGADSSVFNVAGSSSESVTMAAGNLISHAHANSLTLGTNTSSFRFRNGLVGTLGAQVTVVDLVYDGNSGSGTPVSTQTITPNVSINNAAAGNVSPTPMRTVPPALTAECAVRVTP